MLSHDSHQLAISTDSRPEGFHIIRLKGWITLKNEKEFEKVIEQARGLNTILDVTEVPYMDSSGSAVSSKAMSLARNTVENSCSLVLCCEFATC
jgi:anti-anti-sigma factor